MGKILQFKNINQEESDIVEIVRTISVKEIINKGTGEIIVESLTGITERKMTLSEFKIISKENISTEEEVKKYTSKFCNIFKNIFNNL